VIYETRRKKSRKIKSLNENIAPRVRFIGLKIDYAKEYGSGFGNYVEEYRPKVQISSMHPKIELCIYLYPAGNVSGSCIFRV